MRYELSCDSTKMIRSWKPRLLLIALIASAGACKEPVPEFARELIVSHAVREVRAIWRFRIDGETVYYVQSQCCDMGNMLYDQEGTVICSPDGSITGGGDGKCPAFWKKAKRGVLIWEVGQEVPSNWR